jgi:hypothetical protein
MIASLPCPGAAHKKQQSRTGAEGAKIFFNEPPNHPTRAVIAFWSMESTDAILVVIYTSVGMKLQLYQPPSSLLHVKLCRLFRRLIFRPTYSSFADARNRQLCGDSGVIKQPWLKTTIIVPISHTDQNFDLAPKQLKL